MVLQRRTDEVVSENDYQQRNQRSLNTTHVYLWRIHFDIWQNQYSIVKLKNKIKKESQYKDISIKIRIREEFPEELPGHDKVIVQGSDIVYPYTKQENVIGLQQTIREKLPIVSETTPQSGFVPQQVWIDIGGERETVTLQFGRTGGPLNFGPQAASSELSFGRTPGQETELTFGNSNVNNNENQ